ncbi:MAG TPA: ABC transporter permease [Chitinispirillaceae bacterium]|nr:ABC transporter permease [Chitinispirillaceae bacterium]
MFARFYHGISLSGQKIINFSMTVVSMVKLFFEALYACFYPGRAPYTSFASQISRQILYSGVEAFWLVAVIAFLCGCTIIIQAMTNMPRFGVTEYFGNILVVAVVRELGPFFTALVVVGRSGAALAAHLGSMRVNKEVTALEVMGVDPVHFLVVPALAGMTLSMVCLNIYFDVIAIIGGLLVAKITVFVPFTVFLQKVLDALSWIDILISFSKGIFFGIIIAVISSYYGLAVKNIRGVPQATISSVVGAMSVIIIFSVIITVLFYA